MASLDHSICQESELTAALPAQAQPRLPYPAYLPPHRHQLQTDLPLPSLPSKTDHETIDVLPL